MGIAKWLHAPRGLARLRQFLILAVALTISGLVAGCNADDFIRKVNALLTAPGFNLQRLRSIETNQQALTQLDRVDMAVALDADRLQTLVAALASDQHAAEDLAKEGLSITTPPRIQLLPGVIQVQLGLHKTLQHGSVKVDADLDAVGLAIVSGYGNTALVSMRFDTISLRDIKVEGSWFERMFAKLDDLVPVANTTIRAILPVLNAVVEREFNEKRSGQIALHLPKIKSIDLADLSRAGGLAFQNKSIDFNFSIASVSVYVDQSGVLMLAKIDHTDPTTSKSASPGGLTGYPPFDATQPTPTDAQLHAAFEAWKQAYMHRYTQAFGSDAPTPDKPSYVLVSKPFLAQTLLGIMNSPPQVCGATSISANTPPFGADLKFPAFGAAKCPGLLESCKYKDACANESQCTSVVNDTVDSLCPGTIEENICKDVFSWIPFVGNIVSTPTE
ncbi:hypothetical protein, partial [Ralstonia solanacearum]